MAVSYVKIPVPLNRSECQSTHVLQTSFKSCNVFFKSNLAKNMTKFSLTRSNVLFLDLFLCIHVLAYLILDLYYVHVLHLHKWFCLHARQNDSFMYMYFTYTNDFVHMQDRMTLSLCSWQYIIPTYLKALENTTKS